MLEVEKVIKSYLRPEGLLINKLHQDGKNETVIHPDSSINS